VPFPFPASPSRRAGGFTLLELLVVVGVISALLVLLTPALSSLKNSGDVLTAAYAVKGVLEQARNHATINNTYAWVGFFEEDGSTASANPAAAGIGRVVMCTVASKDGMIAYQQPVVNPPTPMDAAKLTQVGNLTKLENVHLRTFPNGTGAGTDTFAGRPEVPGNSPNNAKIGDASPPNSLRPFQFPVTANATAQYTFVKMIEFSPRGECRVNNNNFTIRTVLEVGMQPSHGGVFDTNKNCAIQITGFSGNVRVYQP
jgi:prepilin-type N-terminal cleavage/methylation domain-containing protein